MTRQLFDQNHDWTMDRITIKSLVDKVEKMNVSHKRYDDADKVNAQLTRQLQETTEKFYKEVIMIDWFGNATVC